MHYQKHRKTRLPRLRYLILLGLMLGAMVASLPYGYAQNRPGAPMVPSSPGPNFPTQMSAPIPPQFVPSQPSMQSMAAGAAIVPSAMPPASLPQPGKAIPDQVDEIPVPGNTKADDISLLGGVSRDNETITEAETYFGPMPWTGSIMFNRSSLDMLYGSINGVMPTKDVNLGEPEEAQPQVTQTNRNLPVTTFAPAYYLQSIMFFDQNNWSLWMNGKKNSYGHPRKDNLIVGRIRNDKVEFIWFDPNLNDIIPGWKQHFKPYKSGAAKMKISTDGEKAAYSWDYVSETGDMLVDSTKGAVRFILSPNQSFKSYELSVVEGQAEGKSITFTPGQGNAHDTGAGGGDAGGTGEAMPGNESSGQPGAHGAKDPNALMKRVFNNGP